MELKDLEKQAVAELGNAVAGGMSDVDIRIREIVQEELGSFSAGEEFVETIKDTILDYLEDNSFHFFRD